MRDNMNIGDIFSHDPHFLEIMKNMLQTTFDISFDGVMITEASPGYPIIYVNPSLCAMTGYDFSELLGQSPSMLQGKWTDQRVLDELKEKIEAGKIFHGKTKNYRKNGAEFVMEWKIVPIRDADEKISHYLAVQREVKEESIEFTSLDTKLPFET